MLPVATALHGRRPAEAGRRPDYDHRMPKHNSPNDLKTLDDLSRLDEIIVNKRNE